MFRERARAQDQVSALSLPLSLSTPVALEYDPAGHGTQAEDESAPAVRLGSGQK
jgi:hypothetical protein